MKPKKYSTIIFDWDGCMAQTLDSWVNAYGKVFEAFESPKTHEEIISILGDWHGPSKLGIKDEDFFLKNYIR